MTGIFYGSTTGTTEELAGKIAAVLGVAAADIHNVGNTGADEVNRYDLLLLGTSTWGDGELQDDWYDFLDALKKQNLAGKKIGLFGCGDAESYPDTFCDGVGLIYDALAGSGCCWVGACAPDGYSVTDSKICRDGKFLGLAVDECNESALTDGRIERWVSALKNDGAL